MATQHLSGASGAPGASAPGASGQSRHEAVTLRGATYAALAAIAAAIIGLGSAFIAGYYEADKSEDEFLRNQRQQLYAEYLGAAYDLNSQTRSAEALSPDADRVLALEDSYHKLRRLKDRVQLLASPNTTNAANLLRYQLRDNLETQVFQPYCDSGSSDLRVRACREDWAVGQGTDLNVNYFTVFVVRAREDLDVD